MPEPSLSEQQIGRMRCQLTPPSILPVHQVIGSATTADRSANRRSKPLLIDTNLDDLVQPLVHRYVEIILFRNGRRHESGPFSVATQAQMIHR